MKRGEGRVLVPLDELLARERADLEPADNLTADRIYERRWALTLLEQVLTRLENEYRSAGNAKLFDCLSTQTNKVRRICAKCGATVFGDSPRGFCSVCLFRTGLGSICVGVGSCRS